MPSIERPLTPFPHTHSLSHSASGSQYHRLPEPFAHHGYHFVERLHFPLNNMAVATPPSLLKRASSSGSSSSSSRLRAPPPTPSFSGSSEMSRVPSLVSSPMQRRLSTLSTSSAEPMTPVISSSDIEMDEQPDDFELPQPKYPYAYASTSSTSTSSSGSSDLSMPPPSYNWQDKDITQTTSFEFDHVENSKSPCDCFKDTLKILSPTKRFPTRPTRPALRRKDTPRPDVLSRPPLKRRDTPRPEISTLRALGLKTPEEEDVEARRRILKSAVDGGHWIVLDEEL